MGKRFAILALTGLMGFTLGLTAPPAVGGSIHVTASVSNGLTPIIVESDNPLPGFSFLPRDGALAEADDGRGTGARAQGIVKLVQSDVTDVEELRLKAYASAVNGESASATVFFSDEFTTLAAFPGLAGGFLAMIVDISGTISPSFGLGTGQTHFLIHNSTFGGAGECDAAVDRSGNASCVAFVPIRFNVDNDYLFDFSLQAIAGSNGGEITADFFNSATLPRIELLDQDKHFLRDITVTTASGFQIPGVAAVSEAPEPATILLLAAGLAALRAGKRRRRGPAPSRP